MSKRIVYDTANVLDRDFAMAVEEVRSDAAMTTKPAAESEQLTVEQALAELREMYPNCTAEIVTVDSMGFYKPPTHNVEVAFISTSYMVNERFKGATLTEAMNQVRKWAKEQQ